MKKIFENVQFGDRFVTNDGEIAIFHYSGEIDGLFYLILPNGRDMICDAFGFEIYDEHLKIEEKLSKELIPVDMFDAIDETYSDIYKTSENNCKQSYSCGFQEGVDWIFNKLGLVWK